MYHFMLQIRTIVPEEDISDMIINCISQNTVGCNYLSLPLWWRHQMETFSALLTLCAVNSLVTGEFPSQRRVTRSFDVSMICDWTNSWLNNRDAVDLRRHRAHYCVIVMWDTCFWHPKNTVGCNCLSLPEIHVSGTKVLNCAINVFSMFHISVHFLEWHY